MRPSSRTLMLVGIGLTMLAPPSARASSRGARRHPSRARAAAHRAASAAPRTATHVAASTSAHDDAYDLRVATVLYPYDDGLRTGPGVITVVLENTGLVASPASVVAATPRTPFALASRLSIPSIPPGERQVIEIPVAAGDERACVVLSIEEMRNPMAPPSFLASAAGATGAPGAPGARAIGQ